MDAGQASWYERRGRTPLDQAQAPIDYRDRKSIDYRDHAHWELDKSGQPTNRVIEKRRRAEFITPIPKPKKRRAAAQQEIVFDG